MFNLHIRGLNRLDDCSLYFRTRELFDSVYFVPLKMVIIIMSIFQVPDSELPDNVIYLHVHISNFAFKL